MLVVDDEEDVRILVSRILAEVGYLVDTAADGGDALTRLEVTQPDLIVLDLMMPGVDGWAVLEKLAANADAPPVIVLTAVADYDAFARCVRKGAAGYVCKPFHFYELLAACQTVLYNAENRQDQGAERRREPRAAT